MRRFDLTRAAEADLKAIARFTQDRWGVRQRNTWLKAVDQAFHALTDNPMMGRACDEIRPGYRKLPHGAHIIYYRQPSADEVLVIRILHASMDITTTLPPP